MTSKRSEDVVVSLLRSAYRNARHGPLTRISTSPASRQLSSLVAPSSLLHSSIRKQVACSRSGKLPQAKSQTFATNAKARNGKKREIAVLGGGITGLTTAHYLARHAQNAHITLYEASNKLGGWIYGGLVEINKETSEKVMFQSGPRILRSGGSPLKYDSLVFYDVLLNLGIEDKLLAQIGPPHARYIYYPDHLVKLPTNHLTPENIIHTIQSYLTEPLWDGALKSFFNGILFRENLPDSLPDSLVDRDESVGEFFCGLFKDDRLVDNIISGMMHGIYGGDVYKLSVMQTIFDSFWRSVKRPAGEPDMPLVEAKEPILLHSLMNSPNRSKIRDLANKAGITTMGFEDGLLTLSDSLTKDLKNQKNVTIKAYTQVTSLEHKNGQVSVAATTTANGEKRERTRQYDQVISTIFSKHLAGLVKPKDSLPSLEDTHAVTIMVVNLWFPNPDLLAGKRGFGYLVPTSTPDNDECLLGVLFDSEIKMREERPGTKLTVMMGGHYWDGWTQYPTEEVGRAMALQAVQRHLGIPMDQEPISYASLCRECLPQHYVGHRERMSAAHYELLSAFKGQLTVAGPSYTSIGVMPAMRAGFEAAMRVARGHGPPWFELKDGADDSNRHIREFKPFANGMPDHVGATGLEGFTKPYYNTLVRVKKLPPQALRALQERMSQKHDDN
ncbi:Protoporphyrinogen oxidase [Daldinia loculata]|nr:Protoporphyrinogen oxidase [Daldinia loculata]